MSKLQGTIASVTPIAKVPGLNEVRLENDDRKFTIFNKTDKASGRVSWRADSMQPGETYEFDYEQKANKNPQYPPYHNLSNPTNITGASPSPSVPGPEAAGSGEMIAVCPHCGKPVSVGFYRA